MKRFLTSLLSVFMCLPLSGCGFSGSIYSNYRAIEDLQPVQTLGVDSTGTQVTLSAAVSAAGSSGEPTLLRSSGSDILHTMDALQDISSRGELFFAHTQSLVLGQAYAAGGIGDLLDFVERDVHMRLGTALYVLRGSSADVLITGSADQDITAALAAVQRELELRGVSHVYNCRETAAALSECGAALICALRAEQTAGSVFPEKDAVTAVPDGYGILRGDCLIGFLDGGSAEAAGLLSGCLGTVSCSVPDGCGGTVTLEYSGKSRLQPAWNPDGTPAPMRVEAELSAVVTELENSRAAITDPAVLDALSDALSRQTASDLRTLFEASQTLNADFLALSQTLRRSSAKNFAMLPEDWLQSLEFEIQTETRIIHSYDLGDPVRTKGAYTDAAD